MAIKKREKMSQKVNWIVSDILDFKPVDTFAILHDRALFHFLITPEQIAKYVNLVNCFVSKFMIIATFSENGPLKCSNLEIKRYTQAELGNVFKDKFELIKSKKEDHITPFGTTQNFLLCLFKKKD